MILAVGEASINRAWAATFVLAALVLLAVHLWLPGAKKLAIGEDERTSTSKVQVLLWTYALLFALLAMFFAFLIVQVFADGIGSDWAERLREPIGGRFDDFLDQGIDETYLLLLGFPAAAAITAKGITSTKVAEGTIVKPKKGGERRTSRVKELVSDDEGNADLGDFQYLLFNLLAVAYFLAQFLTHPADGLPDMPDTLVGLTGVAAAAYVAKKGVYRDPPILFSVIPPSGAPDKEVEVHGQRLLAAPADQAPGAPAAARTNVLFGGLPAEIVGEPSETLVRVRVPASLQPGPTQVRVVRPPGAASEELPFEVRG